MPRRLTPRHKHHCFSLNIVPITDSFWDSKGRCCYDESTRGRVKEWQREIKTLLPLLSLKSVRFLGAKSKQRLPTFPWHTGMSFFSWPRTQFLFKCYLSQKVFHSTQVPSHRKSLLSWNMAKYFWTWWLHSRSSVFFALNCCALTGACRQIEGRC